MDKPADFRELGCGECLKGAGLGFDFTMAFQPIVDVTTGQHFAHEALVRGVNGEGAGEVFKHVNEDNRYRFDQACRTKAIKLASDLGITSKLSINFMPNAVYRPELCIRTTLAAADEFDFPVDRIIFEVTEGERVTDIPHVRGIVEHYQQRGFTTAIDDFGAGYAGLNLIAELRTDLIKLDMDLTRGINQDRTRQALVRSIRAFCAEMDIQLIAEGIETREEMQTLKSLGITLMQGYWFAKPAFESLAFVTSDRFE